MFRLLPPEVGSKASADLPAPPFACSISPGSGPKSSLRPDSASSDLSNPEPSTLSYLRTELSLDETNSENPELPPERTSAPVAEAISELAAVVDDLREIVALVEKEEG